MRASSYRRLALLLAALLASSSAAQAQESDPVDPLLTEFRDPPMEARPRVWWHWLNGNISAEGILLDLAWMERVGIGGAQVFDVSMRTPQIVETRLEFMSPGWQQAFRTAASEADRLGLELAVASSPGFSATGGPWVAPQDAMKKLVWSETDIAGGRRFSGILAVPPATTGPFQSIAADPTGGLTLAAPVENPPVAAPFYQDVAVLAWPIGRAGDDVPTPAFSDGAGTPIDGAPLLDEALESAVEIASPAQGAPELRVDFGVPRTIRSARLFVPASAGRYMGGSLEPVLEASDDGAVWREIAGYPVGPVPTTRAFAPVSARYFRVVFRTAAPSGGGFVPPVPGLDFASLGRMLGGSGAAMMSAPALRVGDFRLWGEDRIDRAETRAGFDIAYDYFGLPSDAPDVSGIDPSRIVDLTTRLRPDGSLDWVPPRGRWRVLRLGWSLVGTFNHPAVPEASGLEVDKYDGAAVRRYLDHYIGLFRGAAGDELVGENGLNALLSDSMEAGAANWTPRMIAQFRALRGYDPTPWLPALTGTIIQSRAQSERFLYDYRRTLADLMASEHFGMIAQVAHENGMLVYGEAQENGRPQLGDDLAMRRHTDIPMGALWTYPRERGPQLSYLVDMRGAASVAHIYGQRFVAAEVMTSLLSPWAHAPADLKSMIDLAFVSGINRPVIHTSVHVPVEDRQPGLSLSVFGQYFNRNEAWAELARPWMDYIARNSLMLQQGRNVADLAYFYGEEAPLTGLYSERAVPDLPSSYGYDFVNSDALHEAIINDGNDLVTPGGARYRALYLGGSSQMMTLATLRRLHLLVEGGATVIGQRPVADPSLSGDDREFARLADAMWGGGTGGAVGRGRVIAASNAEQVLMALGVAPDFRISDAASDAEILFAHRQLGDGDSYFISNRNNRAETFDAHFRVTGKTPELWHSVSGEVTPLSYRIENGETVVPMTLDADGSAHVVFRRPATSLAETHSPSRLRVASTLGGEWDVAFEPGRGAPVSVQSPQLLPLNEHADPGIRYFSGIATYSQRFVPPADWQPGMPLWLDLGDAREVAEVTVNGRLAGGLWHAPWRLNIGEYARPGENDIHIRVANLWVNRLIGDAQPGAEPVSWIASPTYSANAPLRPSGLIGPVALLLEDGEE